MNERAQLAAEAETLDQGASIRMVCPFCGGGRSGEATLVLSHTDDGALLFVCHRDNCGASGRLGGGPSLRRAEKRPASPRVLDISGSTYLTDYQEEQLRKQWPFPAFPAYWRWLPRLGRLIFPVKGPLWEHRGYLARLVPGVNYPQTMMMGPKVLTFREAIAFPWQHWVLGRERTPIYVVEDIPSAERLGVAGVNAVAILGTYMTEDMMTEIIEVATIRNSMIVMALDKDAIKKTLAYTEQLKLRATEVTALIIPKDFKNMTQEELNACLNGT